MNKLANKWYTNGYEDGSNGVAKKRLPYYMERHYNQGYAKGKKSFKKQSKSYFTIYLVISALVALLIIYYCNVYLCADSPIVPMRCKAFPWE